MIESITKRLFSQTPEATLYHYTSLAGLIGIVGNGELRASDIRYMNDSAELRHTLNLLNSHITERIVAGADDPGLLNQLLEWLSHRIIKGPMLFGASFRANGNLLSQWRGYSIHGKGVSLGFNPEHISSCAEQQSFQVAKCLYDSIKQKALIERIVDAIEALALDDAQYIDAYAEEYQWHGVFEQIEGDLLRIAAILKHPSFEEEQEWRIVSPIIASSENKPIYFREGASMLVPYYAFDLMASPSAKLELDHVFLGPTSNIDLSMQSISLYLQKYNAKPDQGVSYCQIPYRHR